MEAFRMMEAPSGRSGSAFCTVNSRPFKLAHVNPFHYRARSPKRLGHQLLQLAVEHGGNFRDAGIPELAEERRRPVVLDAGLPSLVLVDEHPQRGVEGGPDVVLRHLD